MLICLKDFFSIRDSAHTCWLDYWLRTALYSLSCACRNPPRCYAIWALRHTLSRALYRPVYHLCRSSSFYIELLKSREHLPFSRLYTRRSLIRNTANSLTHLRASQTTNLQDSDPQNHQFATLTTQTGHLSTTLLSHN